MSGTSSNWSIQVHQISVAGPFYHTGIQLVDSNKHVVAELDGYAATQTNSNLNSVYGTPEADPGIWGIATGVFGISSSAYNISVFQTGTQYVGTDGVAPPTGFVQPWHDASTAQTYTMSQSDAVGRWQSMLTAANDINSLGDPYTLVPNTNGAFNSNSVAATLLRLGGLPYLSPFVQDGTPGSSNDMLPTVKQLFFGSNLSTATISGNTVVSGYDAVGLAYQSITTPQGTSSVSDYNGGVLLSTTQYASATDQGENFSYTQVSGASGQPVITGPSGPSYQLIESVGAGGALNNVTYNNKDGSSDIVTVQGDSSGLPVTTTSHYSSYNGSGTLLGATIQSYIPTAGIDNSDDLDMLDENENGSGTLLSDDIYYDDGSNDLSTPAGQNTFTSTGDSLTLSSGTAAGPQLTTGIGGAQTTQSLFALNAPLAATIGSAFGSALGNALGTNAFQKVAYSVVLGELSSDLSLTATKALDDGFANLNLADDLQAGFSQFFPDLGTSGITGLTNLGVGDFVELLGISGPAGSFLNATVGSALSTVVNNAVSDLAGGNVNIFANLGPNLATAVYSWAGDELASLVIQATTVGGTVGGDVGSAIGSYFLPGVGTFIGDILGTAIGDLFGEPASPQAYVHISEMSGAASPFYSTFLGSKDHGPVADVINLGNVLVTELNGIVAATGGTVSTNSSLQPFNFGIRQGTPEIDGFGGVTKFTDIQSALTFAYFKELSGLRITGGDVYKVRALENASKVLTFAFSFPNVEVSSSIATITGDLAVASEYEKYLADPTTIDALISVSPSSAFAQGWAATLAAAAQLGLDRRGVDDWSAGWSAFLAAGSVDPAQVSFSYTGKERLIVAEGMRIDDTIDSVDKTVVKGGNSAGQTITILDNTLQPPAAGTALTANGTGIVGTLAIPIAGIIEAGSGAGDVVWAGNQGNDVFGGNGGDTLYGYSSPTDKVAAATWIEGGSGSNHITAGISSGDYLRGGSGADTIDASLTNSAWIDGGLGNNSLIGGAGNDLITAGGASTVGNAPLSTFYTDTIIGGGGNDTYLVAPGTVDYINNAQAAGNGTASATGTIELEGAIGFDQVRASIYTGTQTLNGVPLAGSLEIDVLAASTFSTLPGGSAPSGYDTVNVSNDTIARVFIENYSSSVSGRVEYLQLQNGNEFNLSNIGTNFIAGTPGSEFLAGTQNADSIFGGGGTDTVEALGGNDFVVGDGVLSGGNGNDTIFGGNTNDVIWGGPGGKATGGHGGNLLDGGGGDNFILSSAVDPLTTDVNTIHGGTTGGVGADTVIGGPDGNVFQYSAGDGTDLLVSELDSSKWITVYNTATGGFNANFGRDTSGSGTDAYSGDITLTTQGATNLGLSSLANTPIFYEQNTTVSGVAIAANTMNGVVDVEDNYAGVTNTGAGQGTAESQIYWQAPTAAGTYNTVNNGKDTLAFGPGVTPAQLLFMMQGNDLLIGVNDGNTLPNQPAGTFSDLADVVRIQNYLTSGAIGALSFVSSSGSTTTLSLSGAPGGGYTLLGPAAASGSGTIAAPASATADYWITGGYGNDQLVGAAGNDILTAGPNGIDTLMGGTGTNTLLGDGQTFASYQDDTTGVGVTATLANQAGAPVYRPSVTRPAVAPAGSQPANMLADPRFWSTQPKAIAGLPAASSAAVHAAYANTGYAANDQYFGITGLIGSAYGDTLVASSGGSTLDGGGGSDLLVGGAGSDDFVYSENYGNDTIVLGGGADTIDISDIGGPAASFRTLTFSAMQDTAAPGGLDLIISNRAQSNKNLQIQGLAVAGQTLTLSLGGDVSVTFSGLPIQGTPNFTPGGFVVAALNAPGTLQGSTVSGALGATTLVGSTGADSLVGHSGHDYFEGLGGADTIVAATDTTGIANNTVSFQSSPASTVNGAGVSITLVNGSATATGGDASGIQLTNIQNLVGSAYNDSLAGDVNANNIDGLTGNDTIHGGGGADTLIGNGVDLITSGAGNALLSVADCTITGAGSNLIAGAGNDTLYGGSGNDVLTDTGTSGSTTFSSSLNGGGGNDLLQGYGNDTLDGGGGSDTLQAYGGNALLEDSNSNGLLIAGTGADTLFGGAGNNTLVGGMTANDVLISDEGSAGGLSQTTTINGGLNSLFGSGWVSSGSGVPTQAVPPLLTAGDDTFELSSQSGHTAIYASYGVNEIQFDTSVNYQNLVLVRDSGTPGNLDIQDPGDSSFFVSVSGFFNGIPSPAVRDITVGGQVLFLSQLEQSSSTTWTAANLRWQPAGSAWDTISGSSNASNVLIGSPYANTITSNDTVASNTDTLVAGGRQNVITANAASAVITGGSVADTISGGTNSNTITGGSGAESITGGATASSNTNAVNIFTAGSGADTITGGASANVTIYGGSGADSLVAGSGITKIYAGSGSDTLVGGSNWEWLIGGAGAATITAGTSINSIVGGLGSDLIYGNGFDNIQTGAGTDTIILQSASGTAYLNQANASVYGGWGSDTIDMSGTTSSTRDLIDDVSDTNSGGTIGGSVYVRQGVGVDTILGSQATTVDFSAAASGVTVNTATGACSGAAAGDSITNAGTMVGSAYSDSLVASNLSNVFIDGGSGNDTLSAGIGNDTLDDASSGTEGNDVLYGYNWSNSSSLAPSQAVDTFILYGGNNTIYGGNNNDVYRILSGNDTLYQASRPNTGTQTTYQDAVQFGATSNNTLTVVGPSVNTGAVVGTELSFQGMNLQDYDLWFTRPQGTNDLVIAALGASGVQETADLVGWFSNAALQANLADQLFDVGSLTGTYTLSSSATASSHTSGAYILAVNGLVNMDTVAAMPANAAAALALYNSNPAVNVAGTLVPYQSDLNSLWVVNTPPTIALQGNPTLAIVEEISTSSSASVLTFQVEVSDTETIASNLIMSVSSSIGSISASTPVPNGDYGYEGLSTITLTLNNQQAWQTSSIPIVVSVKDIGNLSSSQTFTATVIQVNPAPTFAQAYGSLTMNEGGTVGQKGYLQAGQIVIDHINSMDIDDSSSLTLTATSSNQSLISNGDIQITRSSGGTFNLALSSEYGAYGPDTITFTATSNAAAVNGGPKSATLVTNVNINEVAVTPVFTAVPSSETYVESTNSQTYYISFTATDYNVMPIVSASSDSTWLHVGAVTYGANGNDTLAISIDPMSYTSSGGTVAPKPIGHITLNAVSNQGSIGTSSTGATIAIGSTYQHFDFGLTGPAPITLPENSGALAGIGVVTLTGTTNNDLFNFSIVAGNVNNAFSVSSQGVVNINQSVPWNAPGAGSNSYTLDVRASNGAFTHDANVVVNITDASAPHETIAAHVSSSGSHSFVDSLIITSVDPHALSSTFSITRQNDQSTNTYSISNVSNSGGTWTATIPVGNTGSTDYGLKDTVVVQATNSQGISSSAGITFVPGYSNGKPPANPPPAVSTAGNDLVASLTAAIASFNGAETGQSAAMLETDHVSHLPAFWWHPVIDDVLNASVPTGKTMSTARNSIHQPPQKVEYIAWQFRH